MSLWMWLGAGVIALALVLLAWTLAGQWLIARAHPPAGQFITVDGVRLHYVVAGEGPPVLLVHGASSNLQEFTSSLLPELARRHRVIAFDRPGFGHSQRPSGPGWLDPRQQAELLLKAGEQLGLRQPLLVGHSWGGAVVMAALVHLPERIRGGVLLGGVAGHWAGPLSWTYSVGDLPVLGRLFAWLLVYPLGQFLVEQGSQEVLAPDPLPSGHVERTAVKLALRPSQFLVNVQDTLRLNEFMQLLSRDYDRIRQPLLIIHGERDVLVPFWNHGRRVLPVVPHSELVLLPATGHAPHHTRTDEVAAAIDRFSMAHAPQSGDDDLRQASLRP